MPDLHKIVLPHHFGVISECPDCNRLIMGKIRCGACEWFHGREGRLKSRLARNNAKRSLAASETQKSSASGKPSKISLIKTRDGIWNLNRRMAG